MAANLQNQKFTRKCVIAKHTHIDNQPIVYWSSRKVVTVQTTISRIVHTKPRRLGRNKRLKRYTKNSITKVTYSIWWWISYTFSNPPEPSFECDTYMQDHLQVIITHQPWQVHTWEVIGRPGHCSGGMSTQNTNLSGSVRSQMTRQDDTGTRTPDESGVLIGVTPEGSISTANIWNEIIVGTDMAQVTGNIVLFTCFGETTQTADPTIIRIKKRYSRTLNTTINFTQKREKRWNALGNRFPMERSNTWSKCSSVHSTSWRTYTILLQRSK